MNGAAGPPTTRRLDELWARIHQLRLAVVGDFFLDAYYDCDPELAERSVETGRVCHQVVRTRRQAGAAGTVAANLAALGVGAIHAVGFCGDDGEGYELRRAMARLGLDLAGFVVCADRFTPTYGKPCHIDTSQPGAPVTQELERLDVKNRQPTPTGLQKRLLEYVRDQVGSWSGVAILDQANEAECGVVTTRLRGALTRTARQRPETVFLADSRERIGQFTDLCIKPNEFEAARALGHGGRPSPTASARHAAALSARTGRPVFLTAGARGICIADGDQVTWVPAIAVSGPIDPVGAGDTTSAALLASLAAGATLVEAAWIAVLAASITVQQLGTTGTATRAQIRCRSREVRRGA